MLYFLLILISSLVLKNPIILSSLRPAVGDPQRSILSMLIVNSPNHPSEGGDRQIATMFVAGDIMLSRVVEQKMLKYGFDYPFLKIKDEVLKSDFAFANLETAITPGRVINTGEMMFRSNPQVAPILKQSGFTIVSLANNHTPNFGEIGLKNTFKYLQTVGIKYVGAGANDIEAYAPVYFEVKGIKFAFLAFNDADVVPPEYRAATNRTGTAFMDLELLKKNLQIARRNADVVVVSMHSGTEYKPKPNASQTAFAHAAIDGGADLVIGHHPHVVQTMELYKGKYIFYSLGNFIFDQMWSQDTREGLALQIRFSKTGVEDVKYLPVLISDYSQPEFISGSQADKILKRLR